APRSASVSTVLPRPALTNNVPGFICSRNARSTNFAVAGLSGRRLTTTSACGRSSGSTEGGCASSRGCCAADDANTKRREAISQSPADRPVTDHEHGLAFQVVGWGLVGGTAIPFALTLRLHILWEPPLHRQDRSQDPLRHRTVVHADRPANGYARRGARQKPVDAGTERLDDAQSRHRG